MSQDSSTAAQDFDWQMYWEHMVLQWINKRKTKQFAVNKKVIPLIPSSLLHPGWYVNIF